MAKRRFAITPKLTDKKEPKELPVQDISVEAIEKIAVGKKEEAPAAAKKKSKPKGSSSKKKASTAAKRPQGRPRREEPVKRLSSDLPADLYDKMKAEIKQNGYTLNGFLAKVLREYFDRQ